MVTKGELVSILMKYCPAAEKNFDATDLLYSCGSGSQALLQSVLFVPELIEFKDSILLDWNIFDEESRGRFTKGLREGRMKLEELEASFNFVEVGYLFDVPGQDTTDEEDDVLAARIVLAWQGRLAVCYPDRKFIVRVIPASETGSTVGVEFFERR